jgi:Adenosine/AMP deaminase N-terminal
MMSRQFLTALSLILIAAECVSARFFIKMENSGCDRPTFKKYEEIRREFMEEHLSRALGSDVELNEEEQQLNTIIMGLKADELARGFQNPFNFTPSRHFFEVYKAIESSPLFKIIQQMPKGEFFSNPLVNIVTHFYPYSSPGGILHAHDTAICKCHFDIR